MTQVISRHWPPEDSHSSQPSTVLQHCSPCTGKLRILTAMGLGALKKAEQTSQCLVSGFCQLFCLCKMKQWLYRKRMKVYEKPIKTPLVCSMSPVCFSSRFQFPLLICTQKAVPRIQANRYFRNKLILLNRHYSFSLFQIMRSQFTQITELSVTWSNLS